MRTLSLLCFMLAAFASAGCGKGRVHPERGDIAPARDSLYGIVVADTITYQVTIRNPDPADEWTEQCLSRLNQDMLIDSLFSMVLTGRAVAVDYETKEPMTLKRLREIQREPGFEKSRIGMIQFTEVWYLDPQQAAMTKKVHSLVLGYHYYGSSGELLGHTPVFSVEMKRQ